MNDKEKDTINTNDTNEIDNTISCIATENIGKTYYAYKILGVGKKKTNDGHTYYDCECKYCGYEASHTLRRMRAIGDTCIHYKTVGDVKYPKAYYYMPWKVKNLQNIFSNMVDRCHNPESKDYRFYGAKGIRVCNEWLNEPWEFEKWALNNGYRTNLTIDRINDQKGYYPENCRWITKSENSRFTSKTGTITAEVTLSYVQWSRLLGKSDTYISGLKKRKGIRYTKNYIEEKLLDRKKLIQKLEKKEQDKQRALDKKAKQEALLMENSDITDSNIDSNDNC